MVHIVYETGMTEFPPNCMECVMAHCHLPLCQNSHGGITDKVKKKYTTRRHEDCPLMEVIDYSAKNPEV